jgi:hypothetical protein
MEQFDIKNFEKIPKDQKFYLFSYLTPYDLFQILKLHKTFYSIITHPEFITPYLKQLNIITKEPKIQWQTKLKEMRLLHNKATVKINLPGFFSKFNFLAIEDPFEEFIYILDKLNHYEMRSDAETFIKTNEAYLSKLGLDDIRLLFSSIKKSYVEKTIKV